MTASTLADLLSPTHPADYYPDDPPNEEDDEEEDNHDWGARDWDDDEEDDEEYVFDNDGNEIRVPRRRRVGIRAPARDPFGPPPDSGSKLTAPWPGLDKTMGRLANYIAEGKAALLIVDQVEDLAAMHRARLSTILGMLKALAARSGAAVIALAHNPARNYPRAVTAMQNRLPLASVVFTTALVGPGERRFLVPLRPAMSDDTPAIPFVLPPSPSLLRRQEPRIPTGQSPVIPAEAGIQSDLPSGVTIAWRKPVFPAHIKALADPTSDHGARTRAAQAFIIRALADGPRPAIEVEREAAMHGISKGTLKRARALCRTKATRTSEPGGPKGVGAWLWSLPESPAVQQNETPRHA